MKRIPAALTVIVMLFLLCACSGAPETSAEPSSSQTGSSSSESIPVSSSSSSSVSSSEMSSENKDKPQFEGFYKCMYIGDRDGNYVKDYNIMEDYYYPDGSQGDVIGIAERNRRPWYFEISGDGTFTEHRIDGTERTFKYTKGVLMDENKNGIVLYTGENSFRYEDTPGFFPVFEQVEKEDIDFILAGKAGSVNPAEAKTGDYVCLGTYRQTSGSEEKDPIFWKVIDKKDGKLLLLCSPLLDVFTFSYSQRGGIDTGLTWENSSIREFLNGMFLDTVFTSDEISSIQTVKLENRSAAPYLKEYWKFGNEPYNEMRNQNNPDGPETEDRVFLLSVDEIIRYLGQEDSVKGNDTYPLSELNSARGRVAYVTDYVAAGQYSGFNPQTHAGAWLTRTVCDPEGSVVYVTENGKFFSYAAYYPLFIRPAVWISCE